MKNDIIRSHKSYFVFLDVLGFTDIVEKDADKFMNIVPEFIKCFEKAFSEAMTIHYTKNGHDGQYDINMGDCHFRIFSDSIYIWCDEPTEKDLLILLWCMDELFITGLKNQFPLRGAMTYGDLFVYKNTTHEFLNNETIYGKPLIEAFKLEKMQNWSGLIISSRAWRHIESTWEGKHFAGNPDCYSLFTSHQHFIWYKVPVKANFKNDCSPYGIVLNWLKRPNDESPIQEQDIINGFRKSEDKHTKELVDNTKSFFDYTIGSQITISPNENELGSYNSDVFIEKDEPDNNLINPSNEQKN